MTATDELRRMLDERGVEWGNIRNDGSESDYLTEWQFDGVQSYAVATEWSVGGGLSVEINRHHLTPEQAIEATLGRGACKDVGRYCFSCSECGWIANEPHHVLGGFWPDYCPNCGRKVVG